MKLIKLKATYLGGLSDISPDDDTYDVWVNPAYISRIEECYSAEETQSFVMMVNSNSLTVIMPVRELVKLIEETTANA